MGKDKINITPENLAEWMRSTGFLFPESPIELERFEKLYPRVRRTVSSELVDPGAMFGGKRIRREPEGDVYEELDHFEVGSYRMVGRNLTDLPDEIRKKILGNEDDSKDKESGE